MKFKDILRCVGCGASFINIPSFEDRVKEVLENIKREKAAEERRNHVASKKEKP